MSPLTLFLPLALPLSCLSQMSHLDGASVEPYLLEKSRVLAQGDGERNFHILYELVAGAIQDGGLAKELKVFIPLSSSRSVRRAFSWFCFFCHKSCCRWRGLLSVARWNVNRFARCNSR